MFQVLLILLGIGAIFCLYFASACIYAASREYELPDIEDIDVREIGTQ